MFSGIVEATGRVIAAQEGDMVLRLSLEKPLHFNDLKIGDSIAVNGVCLTLEEFSPKHMLFALGPETLRITGWSADGVKDRVFNLERSLRLNDRIHGHLVTGHVDALAKVEALERQGETLFMQVSIPAQLKKFVWTKGSVAINGVSLTVNAVTDSSFTVGLIPETLRRTNLGLLRVGDSVQLEIDNLARGLVHGHQVEESPCL